MGTPQLDSRIFCNILLQLPKFLNVAYRNANFKTHDNTFSYTTTISADTQ